MADQDGKEEERSDREGDDEEMMARLREEIENLPVREHVAYMMHSLSTLAIGRLGLTADSAARRDLGQARLAIDAFKALLAVLEPVLPAGEVSGHRGILSQLQLAYAGASDHGDGTPRVDSPAAGPGPSPAGTDEYASGEPVSSPKQKETRTAEKDQAAKKAPGGAKKAPGGGGKAPGGGKEGGGRKKPSTSSKKTGAAPKKTSKPGKSA